MNKLKKISISVFTLAIAVLHPCLHADTPGQGDFGLGLMIGEPTAVSGKYFIGRESAIDGGLGLSIINNGFWFHSDYIYQLWDVFDTTRDLPVYFGAGGVIHKREIKETNKEKEDKIDFGPRILVGAEFHPRKYRFSFFGEVAFNIFILHELDIAPGLAFGMRYYFE